VGPLPAAEGQTAWPAGCPPAAPCRAAAGVRRRRPERRL